MVDYMLACRVETKRAVCGFKRETDISYDQLKTWLFVEKDVLNRRRH